MSMKPPAQGLAYGQCYGNFIIISNFIIDIFIKKSATLVSPLQLTLQIFL